MNSYWLIHASLLVLVLKFLLWCVKAMHLHVLYHIYCFIVYESTYSKHGNRSCLAHNIACETSKWFGLWCVKVMDAFTWSLAYGSFYYISLIWSNLFKAWNLLYCCTLYGGKATMHMNVMCKGNAYVMCKHDVFTLYFSMSHFFIQSSFLYIIQCSNIIKVWKAS